MDPIAAFFIFLIIFLLCVCWCCAQAGTGLPEGGL